MRQLFSKILSITTSFALLAASYPVYAVAPASVPGFVKTLTPHERFGSVDSFYEGRGAKMPRLIVVADLHAHVDVQRNLMGILEKLVPTLRGESNKKIPVFLEGGWRSNLEEPLKGFSHPNVRRFMNEYYLHKAELGGPQAYSEKVAGSNQVTMIGVEDKEEYLVNKAIFAKSYPARKQVLEALKFQEAALRLLEDGVEARTYRKLQSMRQKYNEGRLGSERFAKSLVRLANRYKINDRHVTVLRNLRSADPAQVEIAFAQVYRNVSVKLSENRPWTSFLRAKLPNEDAVRLNLSKVTADMDLLKRLVANQLTPSEVSLAISRIANLEQTAELLLKDQPVAVNAKDVIRQSLEFYPMAVLRDQTLVKNSLKSLESFGTDATGILIAGGFHTDAIGKYLKDQRIPYLIIHPNVSRELTTEEQLNYVKRMGNEHVTINELKSDLDAIRSGRLSKGKKASVTFLGAQQNVSQPGEPGTPVTDQFLAGYPAIKMGLETMEGPAYDFAVQLMSNMGLDINNLNRDTLMLVRGDDGKLHVQGEENRPNVLANLLTQRFQAAGVTVPETYQVDILPDAEAILRTGGESDSTMDGDRGRMRIAASRYQALQQEGTPEAYSVQEANLMRATHVAEHEVAHAVAARRPQAAAARQSEAATVALGIAQTGQSIAARLGDRAVGRIADAILPQVQAGAATQAQATGFMQTVANVLTPKTFKGLKAKSVKQVAMQLAKSNALPGATPEQIESILAGMEGDMALAMAQRGVSGPLARKLLPVWLSLKATRLAA
jgi:hypothetical protein